MGGEAGEPPVIPGLQILGRVGGGGFADVYRARALRLDRVVAVKVLRSRTRPSPELAERFEAECRWVARLEHPNVVAVHWADVAPDGRLYLVMEMMQGSLRDEIGTDGLPWPEAADACLQTARALEAAHAIGLVHRDVKPPNVLRGSAGRWKLADFGIARSVEELAAHDAITFTPGFRAPEGQVSASADVYSLGATLFLALRGSTPEPPRSPSQPSASLAALAGLAPARRDLIADMLAHRPEDRPDIVEVCARLEHLLTADGTTAPAPPPAPPAPLPDPPSPDPEPAPPPDPDPVPDPPDPHRVRLPPAPLLVGAVALVVLLVAGILAVVTGDDEVGGAGSTTTAPRPAPPPAFLVAGSGPADEAVEPVATRRQLIVPSDVAFDGDEIYVADTGHHQVLKIGDGSSVTIVAGHGGPVDERADDGTLTASGLGLRSPDGIDVHDGRLYIADTGNHRIVAVDLVAETAEVVAGGTDRGDEGDGGPATEAQLDGPRDVAVDAADRITIADTGNGRVRLVDDGTITTLAGGGEGRLADRGDPLGWSIEPERVAAYRDAGSIVLATSTEIAVVDPDGTVRLVAGGGPDAEEIVGEPSSEVALAPAHISIDSDGGILFVDAERREVLRIGAQGDVEGTPPLEDEEGDQIEPDTIWAAGRDGTGRLVVAFRTYLTFHYVQRFGLDGQRDLAVGYDVAAPSEAENLGDLGIATRGYLDGPAVVAVDGVGQVYVAAVWPVSERRILRIAQGTAALVVDASTPGWPLTTAGSPAWPGAMTFGPDGTLYVSFPEAHQVVAVTDGRMERVLGTGVQGRGDLPGLGPETALSHPRGLAWHEDRGLIVADEANERVLAQVPGQPVELVAGTGEPGYGGDGGPAVAARLDGPSGVAVRGTDIYVLDRDNRRIRVVDDRRLIYKLAGDPEGAPLLSGETVDALEGDVVRAAADALVVTADGAVVLARTGFWHDLVVISEGEASTYVGGRPGERFGPKRSEVELFEPAGLAVAPSGRIVVADFGNDRVLSLEAPTP